MRHPTALRSGNTAGPREAAPARTMYAVASDAVAGAAWKAGATIIAATEPPRRRFTLSRTARTAIAATTPALIVRDREPLERWLRGESALRILVAIDRSSRAQTALDWAERFAGGRPAEIVAAGIDPPVPSESFDPVASVLEAAASFGANLVVVSIARRGWFERWLRRSPAERIVDEVRGNVAVVSG